MMSIAVQGVSILVRVLPIAIQGVSILVRMMPIAVQGVSILVRMMSNCRSKGFKYRTIDVNCHSW
ncbi:hypothetical protein KHA93_12340 [Bacillus sp. FJAT-49732]|uniref:Uncharacterized protein n=1 Tax=Lederbergia citrisecunda TaxID=2833583 RepID=A0A942YM82_9BACI|nr:hypothetical protein [Lederbergia citrisecunda]MBS4200420.1 hypothetical protein [Lederbergia citrisecunda]